MFFCRFCAPCTPRLRRVDGHTEGAPSGCTHVISDGNWQIGVYRYSDDNWSLGKQVGNNGSPYLAGSGDLDLRAWRRTAASS